MKKKIAILLRGIPGSGKSYTARLMLEKYGGGAPQDHIFSTDAWFTRHVTEARLDAEKRLAEAKADPEKSETIALAIAENATAEFYDEMELEEYKKNWRGSCLGVAHEWNIQRYMDAVHRGVTPVIVDNTNVSANDCRGYVAIAEKNGYEVLIQEPTSPWWLDHAHMLTSKQKNGTALEDFARFLAGFHQGMSEKYGTKGNQHGVPLDSIRKMIRRWQPNLTPDVIMGRVSK